MSWTSRTWGTAANNRVTGVFAFLIVLFVGAIVNYQLSGPAAGALVGLSLALLLAMVLLSTAVIADQVDSKLERMVGISPAKFRIAVQDFPDYRFVDVFRAVETYLEERDPQVLDSMHSEDLGSILGGRFNYGSGFQTEPPRVARPTGPAEDEFFPSHRLWATSSPKRLIVRVYEQTYADTTKLEVAAQTEALAEEAVRKIRELTQSQSIFRGRSLDVSFAPQIKDQFGEIESKARIRVDFKRAPPIDPEQVVLDPKTWPIVEHTLVGLMRRREQLAKAGITLKRGLLLYGPPGTGKSLMCRYVASLLPELTTIFCAGTALHQVGSIFNLAKFFKPAIIVLEDVDLVFAAREINAHVSALGDLFDHVDAVGDSEPIAMILTSNAIDRLEVALKDRPGRISQCVYFGPPSSELRRRCIVSFIGKNSLERTDLDAVVRDTDGASQAFLRELVQRALQFAVEADQLDGGRVLPRAQDFSAALAEMRAFDDKAVRSITGFRTSN
jgi:hypothetical protein